MKTVQFTDEELVVVLDVLRVIEEGLGFLDIDELVDREYADQKAMEAVFRSVLQRLRQEAGTDGTEP